MKISDVKVTVWEWRDIPPTRHTNRVASTRSRTAQMALVRVLTDSGVEGNAFLGSALSPLGNDPNLIIERFKPMLVGEDALARERIWQRMSSWAIGGVLRVIGALDVALWDVAAKAAGVPIHRLMGSFRDSVPAYASSAVLNSPTEYAEEALPYDDLYGYVKLKQDLAIPIMATEMPSTGPTAYAPWITSRATDYLRGDVAIKGGLTSCLKTAHLAEAFHMNYEVHHGGNSLNNVANLHLIMAIPNCEYFEVLLPDAVQKHGLVRDIEVDANGLVHAPQGPGLGAAIDFDLIERNKIGEL